MKVNALAVIAAFAASVIVLAAAHSQDEMEFVDNDVFSNPQRPPAVFQHDTHNETAAIEECAGCHHLYEDGELVADDAVTGSPLDQRASGLR